MFVAGETPIWQVVGIERASADRAAPRCRYFGRCGGCSLQHLTSGGQVKVKQAQVLSALERISGVVPDEVAPPVIVPIWNYRRRARLGISAKLTHPPTDEALSPNRLVRVGFRERKCQIIMGLECCEVLDQRVGRDIGELASALEGLDIRTYIPQVEVATSQGGIALVLRVLQMAAANDQRRLYAYAAEQGMSIYLQSGGPDSVVPLATSSSGTLNYSPDGGNLLLEFGPTDFVQVNELAGQAMVRQSLGWLDPDPSDHVLDLFAGLGNFTLPLAARGVCVTAVDGDPRLVCRGRTNAERNNLSIDFIEVDLMTPISKTPWVKGQVDLALLDPPRAGAREVVHLLGDKRPHRILYVSCHPGSLARDARLLISEHGFRLRKFGIIDMFPHTTHVESMALFEVQ